MLHSESVANIALNIAISLKLCPEEMRQLYEEALYHDVGKSRISELTLNKKGKLSSDEWNVMKEHAIHSEILYLLMKNEKENIDKANVIRHHHENWDGTGYPDKLSGEEIPLHSRIIRIADILDAITRPRIYRPYKIENYIELMEKMQGKK